MERSFFEAVRASLWTDRWVSAAVFEYGYELRSLKRSVAEDAATGFVCETKEQQHNLRLLSCRTKSHWERLLCLIKRMINVIR